RSFAEFRAFWDTVRHDVALVPFFRHLLFVEQPLHRDVALSHDVHATSLHDWSDHPPIIIDESDSDPGSMGIAVSKGYAGTSHKKHCQSPPLATGTASDAERHAPYDRRGPVQHWSHCDGARPQCVCLPWHLKRRAQWSSLLRRPVDVARRCAATSPATSR